MRNTKISKQHSAAVDLNFKLAPFQQSTISHVEITRNQAQYMLEEYHWNIQRKVIPCNVATFDRYFLDGEWDDYSTIEISTTPEGVYINDGQNRLSSVVSTGARLFRIIDTPFDSIEKARMHYANTDRNGSKRGTGDMLKARVPELDGRFTPMEQTKIVTAIRYMNSAFNEKRAQGRSGRKFLDHEISQAAREWATYAEECYKLIRLANRNIKGKLQLCPVLSIMLVTIRYNPDQSKAFWNSVVQDNGLKTGQPEKTLINFLTSSDCGIEKLGANVFARRVATAYNDFCSGKKCETLRSFAELPIFLKSTPYNRKHDYYYEPGQPNGGLVIV